MIGRGRVRVVGRGVGFFDACDVRQNDREGRSRAEAPVTGMDVSFHSPMQNSAVSEVSEL
jgi:hypothetical protein